ncbi:hypothetical protein AAF712_008658 [Marasmius tenuissimus]|uniref:Uncharacterized protein n=1 Tax=Marasmius tenuissimus TaxID=585030 RepID=A0ABR2ZSH8_9AGAR
MPMISSFGFFSKSSTNNVKVFGSTPQEDSVMDVDGTTLPGSRGVAPNAGKQPLKRGRDDVADEDNSDERNSALKYARSDISAMKNLKQTEQRIEEHDQKIQDLDKELCASRETIESLSKQLVDTKRLLGVAQRCEASSIETFATVREDRGRWLEAKEQHRVNSELLQENAVLKDRILDLEATELARELNEQKERISGLERAHLTRVNKLNKEHEEELETHAAQYDERIEDLQREYEDNINSLNETISTLRVQATGRVYEIESLELAAVERIRDSDTENLEDQINELRQEKETFQENIDRLQRLLDANKQEMNQLRATIEEEREDLQGKKRAEQSQVTGENDPRVISLNNELKAARQQVTEANTNAGGYESRIAALQNQVEALQSKAGIENGVRADLERRLQTEEQQVAHLQEQAATNRGEYESRITALQNRVEALQSKAGVENDSRVISLNNELKAARQQVTEANTNAGGYESRIAALQNQVEALQSKAGIESGVRADLERRLQTEEQQVAHLQEQANTNTGEYESRIAALQDWVEALQSKAGVENDSRVISLNNELKAARQQVTEANTNAGGYESRIAALQNQVEALQSKAGIENGVRADLERRLQTKEQQVAHLQEQANTNTGEYESRIAALQDRVEALQSQTGTENYDQRLEEKLRDELKKARDADQKELLEKYETWEAEKVSLEQNLRKANSHCSELLLSKQSDREGLTKKVAELEAECSSLSTEVGVQRNKAMAALTAGDAASDRRYTALDEDYQATLGRLFIAQNNLQEAQQDRDAYKSERDRLRTQKEGFNTTLQDIEDREKRATEAKDKEIRHLVKEVASRDEVIKENTEKLEILQEELHIQKEDLKRLKGKGRAENPQQTSPGPSSPPLQPPPLPPKPPGLGVTPPQLPLAPQVQPVVQPVLAGHRAVADFSVQLRNRLKPLHRQVDVEQQARLAQLSRPGRRSTINPMTTHHNQPQSTNSTGNGAASNASVPRTDETSISHNHSNASNGNNFENRDVGNTNPTSGTNPASGNTASSTAPSFFNTRNLPESDVPEPDPKGPESRTSAVLDWYKCLQPWQYKPDSKRERNEVALMMRRCINETLPVATHTLSDVWTRDGVTAERLRQFQQSPNECGPGESGSWIQHAKTTKEMHESAWNRQLEFVVARKIGYVYDQCPDKARFGKPLNWAVAVRQRFTEIYSQIARAQASNEAEERDNGLIVERLLAQKVARNIRNTENGVRDTKFKNRLRTTSAMSTRASEEGDDAAYAAWQLLHTATALMGPDGMSDEEVAQEMQTTPSGVRKLRTFKKVLSLRWRHPAYASIYEELDVVPDVENSSFRMMANKKTERVRVSEMSRRGVETIPKGLPRSFFAENFLDRLLEYERSRLEIAEEDFPVFPSELYVPQYGDEM